MMEILNKMNYTNFLKEKVHFLETALKDLKVFKILKQNMTLKEAQFIVTKSNRL